MKFYFVATGISNKMEIATIKELQPKYIMASYHYFKNTNFGELIKRIGYKPKILLDSGAFSAYTSGKPINLEKYIDFIKINAPYIENYICLDILGDTKGSYEAWETMRARGLDPIPVFHYLGDESYMEKYIQAGIKRIALGGTVPIKSKTEVAEWVRMIGWMYPEVNFHLLGSASAKILDHCDIESADASTWMMGAIMGQPKHIPGNDKESRSKRAKYNMQKMIERYGLTN